MDRPVTEGEIQAKVDELVLKCGRDSGIWGPFAFKWMDFHGMSVDDLTDGRLALAEEHARRWRSEDAARRGRKAPEKPAESQRQRLERLCVIDQQQTTMSVEGVMSFPDFAFADLPVQPGAIKDTDFVLGSVGGASMGVIGTVSQTSQGSQNPPFPGS